MGLRIANKIWKELSKSKSNLKKYANKVLSQNKMTKNAVNPSRVETMFENFFNKLLVSF